MKSGIPSVAMGSVRLVLIGFACFLWTASSRGQTNTWINTGGGKWETSGNWSQGGPSLNQSACVITNANAKTVLLDGTTAGVPSTLTVSNLLISGASLATNTLAIAMNNPSTALQLLDGLVLSAGAAIYITNSMLIVDITKTGKSNVFDGPVTIDNGGTLLATNLTTYIGSAIGSSGQLTMSSGSRAVFPTLTLGKTNNSLGNVTVTGGSLSVTNVLFIGSSGIGQMTVSGGIASNRTTDIGGHSGLNTSGTGTLTVSGGTFYSQLGTFIGYNAGTTGSVWVTGGTNTFGSTTAIGVSGCGQMTISNGTTTMYYPTLCFGSAPGAAGTFTLAGGDTTAYQLQVGGNPMGTGVVWMTGGNLTMTSFSNSAAYVGYGGTGLMSISNGVLTTLNLVVGAGLYGSLTIAGPGVASVWTNATVGFGGTGIVWIVGGQLLAPTATLSDGYSGTGEIIISNGAAVFGDAGIASGPPASGALTMAGGSFTALADLIVGNCSTNATGTVAVNAGSVFITNVTRSAFIDVRNGTVEVGGGRLVADTLLMTNFCGTFVHNGGTSTIGSSVVIGGMVSNGVSQITINGGVFAVTNAAQTATLNVMDGTLTVNGGTLIADNVVMTNVSGRLFHVGGAVSVRTMMLDPNLSATGDALPNWWKQQYGLDPFSSNGVNGVNGDPDGDGMSNWQEYLAGTNPTNSASALRIISLVRTGNDMLVTWTTRSDHANVVQAAPVLGGIYSNISPFITITGSGDVTTNYLDVGGATNGPSRFYRVALVQPIPDHFLFTFVGGVQTSSIPFNLTITAMDATNGVLTGFSDAVALGATGSVGGVSISPQTTPLLKAGQWSGTVVLNSFTLANVAITATDASGHTSQSSPFYVVRPATNIFIAATNRVDMVADSSRGLLYITDGDRVDRYNLLSGNFLSPFILGGSLMGIDISPDNNTLVVADQSYNSNYWVDVVDLTTGNSRQAKFPAPPAGSWSVAFGNDGAVLITGRATGSGDVPLRRYVPATGDSRIINNFIDQDSMVSSSGDGATMGIVGHNDSGGPLDRYDVASQTLTGPALTEWETYEVGVNRDGTQFAAPTYNGTYVFDGKLRQIGLLGSYASQGPIGLAYHPQADLVFFAWCPTSYLRVFDTHTFSEVARYDCGYAFSFPGNNTAFQQGRVRASRDGNNVFVTVGGGVRWISREAGLPADLGISQIGSANPVRVGSNLTYTITMSNGGPFAVSDAQVLDGLQPGVTFVSANVSQGATTLSNGVVRGTLGALANGGSATMNITITAPVPAILTNVAMVTSSAADPNPDNNTATLFTSAQTSIPPSLTIAQPVDNSYVTNASVTVAGTSASAYGVAAVSVNGMGASTANGYGNWVVTVGGLIIGPKTLTATAADNYVPPDIATNVVHVIYAAGSYDGNGDGLPDLWQLQYFGCVTCPAAAPGNDADGSGFSNLQDYLVGVDPTNPSAAFRITSVLRTGVNVLVTWTMGPGRTNALQATAGDASGYNTNDFTDIFTVTNTVGAVTNYVDHGAATNIPGRYYRVRLVP